MNVVVVLGLVFAISSITGWTFEADRASKKMCLGEPRERSMAVWAPRPWADVPVITTGKY